MANKVCALFGRALPRDFLDVDAAITSGRYTRERLLELAANADLGFAPVLFADALGALPQITDAACAEYRIGPDEVIRMRHRFAQWRQQLLAEDGRPVRLVRTDWLACTQICTQDASRRASTSETR